jgi:Tol biopolymer transport system component
MPVASSPRRSVPLSPFARAFLLTSLILAALTGLVILRGDQTDLRPLETSPANGQTAVSTRPLITLRYRGRLDPSSVEGHFSLSPPADGTLEVDGGLMRFAPRLPLRAETRYEARLAAGVRDQNGRVSRRDLLFSFETRPPRLLVSRPEPGGGAPTATGVRNLWTVAPDGSDARRVTDEPLGVLFVSVAPDGERLAYSSPTPGQPDASALWSVRPDGSDRRQLAGDNRSAIVSHAWSPRGDLIIYERRPLVPAVGVGGRVGPPRLMGVRPDGTQIGPLYGRDEETGFLPSFSPDGTRFSFYESSQRALAISDFTDQVRLIPAFGLDSGSWDPSGSRLVYADTPTEKDISRTVLREVDAAGGEPREVSPPGFNAYSPAWSPDGRAIAFIGRDPGGTTGCWRLDLAGGSARPVLSGPNWTHAAPLFSPDGRFLAVSRLSAGAEATWELWVGPSDGSDLRLSPFSGLAEAWAP